MNKDLWIRVLNNVPLPTRRKAAYYLWRVKRIDKTRWLVWSSKGKRYIVYVEQKDVKCTCPYSKGYCKHIAAVAANILADIILKE